jgi:6-phosphogluconolactonase (cycloisomerase 2 family)
MKKLIYLMLLTVFCALRVMAQGTFVYTNNDRTPNSISAFSAAANGSLTAIAGSPFATGGDGAGGGAFGSNRITTAVVKNFLYAGNSGSNTVGDFSIDPVTGVLTSLPGSPFATGGVAGAVNGMSLTTTPDDKFLIVANGASMTITVFSIAANGTLSPIAGSPFASGSSQPLVCARVTSDAKFLAVSSVTGIAMFNIATTGALTPVAGSPTPDAGASGIDFNCAGTQLFVALTGGATSLVDVFNIGPSGTLTRIAGSPFNGPGANSNVAVLSPDDSKLFVSAQNSETITVFKVTPSGALTVVPGSPVTLPGATFASGMALNQTGTLLYTAAFNNLIYGFTVAPTGALTSVMGSPFSNGFPGQTGLLSVAAFPGKNCCPAPVINNASASPEVLWPPNHKMVEVTVNYSVTNPCPATCVLTVSSNEPINGIGDGNTSPDWEVVDAHHVFLRAERSGNGPGRIYTITITCTNDTNRLSSTERVNVIVPHDQGAFFVAQNYLDFLSRQPDESGWSFWTNQINSCGTDEQCLEARRISVSASFFLSIEFQNNGFLVERLYKIAYGDAIGNSTFGAAHQLAVPVVRFNEFVQGTQEIGKDVVVLQSGWEEALQYNKQVYAGEFVETPRFIAAFPATMAPADFVDKLNQNGGNLLSPSERTSAIALFGGAADSSNATARAQVVLQVAEDPDLSNAEFTRAFVMAEYFGYLRRNPNDAPDMDYTGFDFWLTKLNQFHGNYLASEMVKAFTTSIEYQQRFGP